MVNVKTNSKGMTLLEVLLALAVSTIVIGVVTSVLINSMNSYTRVIDRHQTDQQANLILETFYSAVTTNKELFPITISQEQNQIAIKDQVIDLEDNKIILTFNDSISLSTIAEGQCTQLVCEDCDDAFYFHLDPKQNTKVHLQLVDDQCRYIEFQTRLSRISS